MLITVRKSWNFHLTSLRKCTPAVIQIVQRCVQGKNRQTMCLADRRCAWLYSANLEILESSHVLKDHHILPLIVLDCAHPRCMHGDDISLRRKAGAVLSMKLRCVRDQSALLSCSAISTVAIIHFRVLFCSAFFPFGHPMFVAISTNVSERPHLLLARVSSCLSLRVRVVLLLTFPPDSLMSRLVTIIIPHVGLRVSLYKERRRKQESDPFSWRYGLSLY